MRMFLRALLAACLAGCGGAAVAAALQISPVLVELAPTQGASGIMLRNPGSTPIYGQVRIYGWEQADGDDVLSPTEVIQASPPIIQVPPGGEQLVRLVRVSKDAPPLQQGFRLIIDEIPDPSSPGVNGVVLRLRYSVPVFVAGMTPSPEPELAWRVERSGGDWVVRLSNSGSRYAQVAALQILNAAGKPVAEMEGLLGYALANSARQWNIPGKQGAAGPVKIRAMINGDMVTVSPR
ncbi:MAG: molecular chaperone [Achromobacter sp.]|uniref:fimbrial biogenesis chaperone n=1 Tax=unclassified Achromobacter TaxID=2626865 RepID=UPI0006FEEA54|nr:fimbria/pilus periplasmic chaperone [Achromobacter sp. Root565]KRA03176.1 oxidoreductase [Achromobacter sp. Root565]